MSVDKISSIWPEWKVAEQLGEGTYGKVYKAVREEHGVTSNAAIKIVSIPQSDAEISSLKAEGLDESGTRSYFEGLVTDFVNEIKAMESLKGTANIVSIEDYKVVEKDDKIGWDIFIRMELLTPLNDYIADNKLSETEVIKLGRDICQALELCAQRNIIHRDIKPENIFVSSFGDFKVGDFGVARELEKTGGSLSKKGTPNYMAPEVELSKDYGKTVDIYSLGLVLYKLLNNNRLPFLDPYTQLLTFQDRKSAIERRLKGEALPPPVEASPQLAQIILTACAFNPSDRFQTPTAFKNVLGSVVGEASTAPPPPIPAPVSTDLDVSEPAQEDLDATTRVRRAPQAETPVAHQDVEVASFGKQKKKSKAKGVAIFLVVLLLLGAGGFAVLHFLSPDTLPTFLQFGNDPVADVIAALEAGDYTEALALVEEMDGDSDVLQSNLQSSLQERLRILEADFLSEEIEYSIVMMELSTIERMNVTGLSSHINHTRSAVNRLNDSRTAFNTAESLYERGNFEGAIAQFILVIQEDPNYTSARAGVGRASDAHRREALATADRYSAAGNYGTAIRVLSDALLVLENDSAITQQLNLYRASQETAIRQNALETAESYANNSNWTRAIAVLNDALRDLPSDSLLTERVRSYEESHTNETRQGILDTASAYANNQNLTQAIVTLNDGLRTMPGDSAITDRLRNYEQQFVTHVIANAEDYLAQRNHAAAITHIDWALQIVPNDAQLVDKLRVVEAARPVSLGTLVVVDSQRYGRDANLFTDSFGNHYHESFWFSANGGGGYHEGRRGYAVYNLGDNFTRFFTEIVAPAGLNSNVEFLVEITFNENPTPVAFVEGFNVRTGIRYLDVDVTGVTTMTITVRARGYREAWRNNYHNVRLVNATLSN